MLFMALKSTSPASPRPFLHLAKRFYHAVGWVGVAITLVLASVFGIDMWGRLNPDMLPTYRLIYAFVMFLGAIFVGLFLSGLAFLISTCIDVACDTMENGRVQTELLRRLVREQSDVDASSRSIENGYRQTELLHHLEHEQSDVQSR
jgi:hypothetical protein